MVTIRTHPLTTPPYYNPFIVTDLLIGRKKYVIEFDFLITRSEKPLIKAERLFWKDQGSILKMRSKISMLTVKFIGFYDGKPIQ